MAWQGTVKFFNTAKGFGFIRPESGNDVFVHATALKEAGISGLDEGDQVTFDVVTDARGRKAVNLRRA